ncbi:MAG TPA: ABC transporter permease [Gemmatimonadales bacterium]|jgi:predicted permease|nr:ABC transporter permease [Gemmatimonadales bacterium]
MLIPDFRFALRSLRRAPGFTLAVVLTLGLGIGANTAIFSVVRGVLLRPLPHKNGDRLVYLRQGTEGAGGENVRFSVPEITDFRTVSRTLHGIAEYSPMAFALQGESDAVRVDAGLVTGNYFNIMGLSPVVGRLFNDGDDGRGAAPVMVLTHEYWMKRFHGDRGIVGKSVRLNGKGVTVVGVVQPAPTFPERMDILLNMVNSEHHLSAMMVTGRTHRMTEMIARLASGATVEQAKAEVAEITRRVHADYPEAYDAASGYHVTLKPFHEVLGEKARLTLWLLMGAAAFVLIIACANVVNLTLMRGVRREHELVVRAALGAGAARLRRLLLAENLVLAIIGGGLGLLVAFGGVGMLIAFAQRYSPRANEIRVDGVVLGFTLALALLVAVILSYAPKLAQDSGLAAWLAGGGKRATGNLRRQRLQRGLVVAQVAVSVVLLTGAGLLTRTMMRLSVVNTGMNTENVLTMEVQPDGNGLNNAATIAQYEEMQSRLAAIPGVKAVAVGSTVPLRSAGFMLEIKAEGRPVAPGEPMPRAEYRTATPGYFRAAGIPVLKGKDFASTDRQGTGLVVILNQTLADRLFPDQDPIGRRVAWTGEVLKFIPVSGEWRTVVGVVGSTKDGGLEAEPLPVMFQPFAQQVVFSGGLVIRAGSDASAIAPAATRIVRGLAPRQPIEKVLTLDQIKDESVAPRRLNAVLVAAFGILAVIIAAVGIAGVLAFSVSARTNEIGIRMSLGADSGRVQRMVLMEGGVLLGVGLLLGVTGSLVAARLIQGLLFGVAPHDPVTLAAVATLMAAIGLGACWVPALRAARIDPGVAIRAQ